MRDSFFFGDWQVEPDANSLRCGKKLQQLEPKAMDVLLLLCRHAGEVLSSDDIVSHCWPQAEMGDNPLHKTINQLRKALGDSATSSRYIETIRKRGYRTVADVRFPLGHEAAVQSQQWQSGSPYPGLKAYDASYAGVFFGRSEQISILSSRIAQQIQYGRAFCLVLGPSGSGKSSLISAGVLPNLMQPQGFHGVRIVASCCLDLADAGKGQLMLNLAGTLLDWEINDEPVLRDYSAAGLAEQLLQSPDLIITQLLNALPEQHDAKYRLALFADRLEVLLSSPLFDEAERAQFVSLLEQLAVSGAVLVLSTCRNEFYPLLVNYPSLMAGKSRGAHFDLAPPSRTELLQMIRLPAVAAGLQWDSDPQTAVPLDEQLCSDAASNPDALPMLQYTLQELYLRRSGDNKMLLSVYRELGGIEGAIGKNAEQALAGLDIAELECLPRVLSLLVTLREDEKAVTSRSARWGQLECGAEHGLVTAMVEHRLFVSHLQNGEACFSIAHEALLRRWPRATSWINEHYDSLSVKSRLHHLTRRWQDEGRNRAYLLAEGKPLQQALQLAGNRLFTLDKPEQDFIAASARRAWLLRWGRIGTALVLVTLTFMAILMSYKSQQSEQLAQQKRLAAENLLGFMVGDFADKLRSIGRMDLLDGISNKALEYFSDPQLADSSSFEARLQHGQTLEAIGEVAYSRGQNDEAVTALLAAGSSLRGALELQPEHRDALKTLGTNAFWLGQIRYDANDWESAENYLKQYLQYSQQFLQLVPGDVEALMEVSYAHNSLGSVAMQHKQFSKAVTYFRYSLALKNAVAEQKPDNMALLGDIADTRSWLASAAIAEGEIQQAIDVHLQIQADFEAFSHRIRPDAYLLDKVFSSYDILASLYAYQGKYQQAFEKAYQAHQLINQALQADADNEIWLRDLFRLKLKLMRFNMELIDRRINYHPEELQQWLNSQKERFAQQSRFDMLHAEWSWETARYYQRISQWQQSASVLQPAIAHFEQLFMTGSKQSLAIYADVLLLQANHLRYINQRNESQLLCQKVVELLDPIQHIDHHPRYLYPYAQALSCLGELDQHPGVLQRVMSQGLVLDVLQQTTQISGE